MIAGLLAVAAMTAQAGAFASVLPEDVAGTRFEEPIQILSALGIMNGDEDGKFRPTDSIKRSEVARMAMDALGLGDAAAGYKGVSKYPDVPTWHWANGYINLATIQGIIVGDDTGNFRPDDSITYEEAMTIFVRLTGYTPLADAQGGFPNGYVSVGTQNNLSKNVEAIGKAAISRGDVAYMTTNALNVKLMERKNLGAGGSYEVTDKTLLSDKLGITKAEGQITAIEKTALDGSSSLRSGQVKIGDQVFETAYNMNHLLGHNVTYYWKENESGSDEIILALSNSKKNKTVEIIAPI